MDILCFVYPQIQETEARLLEVKLTDKLEAEVELAEATHQDFEHHRGFSVSRSIGYHCT